jgi:enterochelin esterase family protein
MSGRLAPVAELVAAARSGAPDLGARLLGSFPALATPPEEVARQRAFVGEAVPTGLGASAAVVWEDTALLVVTSQSEPAVSVNDGPAVPLSGVAGTSLWTALVPVETGRLHRYRFGVGDAWGRGADFAGYEADSYERPGVTRGSISERRVVVSDVYPGATTEYWLYVNHGVDESRGAPVLLWNDGGSCLEPDDLHGYRMQVVTDNLVHRGLLPPLVHVLVNPSLGGEGKPLVVGEGRYGDTMRGVQYDTVSDRYGRHIVDEVLPDAGTAVKLRSDAYSRAVAGASSGALCAFTLAWFRPDAFSRVHSVIGGFSGIRWDPARELLGGFAVPNLVRREPKRNLRVWLSDGANDFELDGSDEGGREVFEAGSLPLHNILLANALKARGYDFHFRFGEGYHSFGQAALDLPESLAWLWRGYDPERTEETFEQDAGERAQPMFRVGIVNRR